MSITAGETRKHLCRLIEEINKDHTPLHITSDKGNAVLMSEEDVTSWQETSYLLRSPANARHLADSVAEAEAGKTEYRELVDLPDAEDAG
ncbi:type II toxin-antitoxin system Phd/YefM family antitoxin [Streptomyces sp. NPDC055749]